MEVLLVFSSSFRSPGSIIVSAVIADEMFVLVGYEGLQQGEPLYGGQQRLVAFQAEDPGIRHQYWASSSLYDCAIIKLF